MMKLKSLALFALTLVMVSACSNNNPNSYPIANNGIGTYGYNGYQTGLYGQTGMYGQNGLYGMSPGYNPYVNYSYSSQYSAQAALQARAMFSISFRAATPNFYYPQYTNNNCMMRSQVNYTPNSCACTVAPCNCQQVLTQIRQECNQPQVQARTQVRRSSCSTCTTRSDSSRSDSEADRNDNSSTSDNRGNNRNDGAVTTNTSKRMSLSVVNADARALYERLAKDSGGDPKAKSKILTGANYKCFLNGKASKDESYACDFDVNLEDGSLYQQYPVSNPGQPVITTSTMFSGKNVTVGGPGLAPEEGFIKFGGNIAAAVYKRIPGDAVPGAIDAEGKVQADVKKGKSLKCYKTTNTASATIECSVKIKTDSGDTLDASTY